LSTVRRFHQACEHALRVGLEIRPPRHEIEVRHVRAVAVQEHDLFEAVIGQRLRDVEHVVHEMLEVVVDRAREVHHVPRVAVADGGEDEHLVGDCLPCASRDPRRADDVDVERQVGAVLLHGAAGYDADFPHLDGVVDLGPGELLVAIFRLGAACHGVSSKRAFLR
jgi:hypothetical protein